MTPQENFSGWLDEHYDMPGDEGGLYVCKRCGNRVGYVTKHAVERHGDAIEVMPARNTNRELADAY